MKLRIGITLKMILIIAAVSSMVIFVLAMFSVMDDYDSLEENVKKDAHTLMPVLDSYFADYDFLYLESKEEKVAAVNSFLDNVSHLNVLSLNVNLFENTSGIKILMVYASNDEDNIGILSEDLEYNLYSIVEQKIICFRMKNSDNFFVVIPIYFSEYTGGEEKIVCGTYEMKISLETEFDILAIRSQNVSIASLISLGGIIILLSYILRDFLVKKIFTFRDAAIHIGAGNLNTRVTIKSRDEFGELSSAFNQMANDLKESRDKIEDYNKILENLLEQKDEFIGQLGHDLKNPLQPLVGLLPMLIEKETDPTKKEILEVMNENVEYMQHLIFDTLKLAKLRSDKIEFNFEKLNLREQTEKVIKSQKMILDKNNIEIENKIRDDIFVKADRLRVSEILNNLISNSVKYTKNSGKIVIYAKKDNKFVVVSLKDTGIGMTEDQVKKIFDEFYKVDISSSDEKSTGLGLSICKRIVEKHGGRIGVESLGIGKGSTFFFTLELVEGV